jgi:hypothetical protein
MLQSGRLGSGLSLAPAQTHGNHNDDRTRLDGKQPFFCFHIENVNLSMASAQPVKLIGNDGP